MTIEPQFSTRRARQIGLEARAAFAAGDPRGFDLARLELDLLAANREAEHDD